MVTPLTYSDDDSRQSAGFPGSAHSACIFKNDDERFESVVPFILSGLDRGDKCVYVLDETSQDEVYEALMESRDIERHMEEGCISFIEKDRAYLKEGRFDAGRMLRFVLDCTERAVAEGYAGLTATGEMSWYKADAPGSDQLMIYEARLNDFFCENAPTLLCQYDESVFDHTVLIDAIRTHPRLILNGEPCVNPYYIPPDEFLSSRNGVITQQTYERTCRDILRRDRFSMIHRMEMRDFRQMRMRVCALENSGLCDVSSMIEIAGFYADMARESCTDPVTLSHLDIIARRCEDAQQRMRYLRAYLSIGQSEPEWRKLEEIIGSACVDAGRDIARTEPHIAGIEILADGLINVALSALLRHLPSVQEQADEIRLGWHRAEDDLVVSLRHADEGVPEPIKEALFRFGYAYGGSDGFGLYLAAEILSSLGMKVCENGIVGRYTTFEIRIPYGKYRATTG